MSIAKRASELKKTDPLRKKIEVFLSGEENNIYSGEYIYIGKSKKIKTEKVIVISDLGDRCKVKDLENNITTITKTMLKNI